MVRSKDDEYHAFYKKKALKAFFDVNAPPPIPSKAGSVAKNQIFLS